MKSTPFATPSHAVPVHPPAPAVMVLRAPTAADLMVANPVSIRGHASVHEALALLSDHGFSAVLVINREGHPVGVLTRTDLVRFERERTEYLQRNPITYESAEMTLPTGEELDSGFQVETESTARIDEIMTPKVFSVLPETHLSEVVRLLVEKHIHHLFVVDRGSVLVGVISTMDVLAHLQLP
ncbi:MAG: CBS domain-containing protein [Rhodanobacteraceae bacterium]